jgi:solute carrier family 25 2-oxodicarboxylate transporter 21
MGAGETGGVFLAGAAAGIFEGIVVQPMEMVKTRFQINTGQSMRIIPTMRAIVAEGGVRQLYRGGLPEIMGLVPRSSAMWSGYEFSRRELTRLNGGTCNTQIVAAAGVAGGCCEGVAFSPFQVVKVRLMAKEHLGRYKNTLDCVVQIVRNEGVTALTIGLAPTLWRNCVWDSIYLAGMYNIDQHVPKPDNAAIAVVQNGLLGTAMGMFATCFNAPFDVVKSRFQAQLPGSPNPYTSVFGTLRRIIAEEGAPQVYRGLLPKAIRLGVGQTVGLMVFQALLPEGHVES